MNTILHWLKSSSLMKVINLLLIVSFIILPITPVFAEEPTSFVLVAEETTPSISGTDNGAVTQEGVETEPVTNVEIAPSEQLQEDLEEPEEETDASLAATGAELTSLVNDMSKVILGEIDEHSGSFSYSYPFPLSPYRGMNPELSLNYNSQSKSKTSITGYGFELSIPYIQRLNRDGVGNMYNETNFYSSFSGELYCNGGNVCGSKSSDDRYLQYTLNADNSWSMITKDGIKYNFGIDNNGRQYDPNNSNNIYTWYLASIIDLNGNTITYSYTKDTNQVYPDEINYGPYKVEFSYQNGNDSKMAQYFSGFNIKSEKKLSNVQIFFNNAVIRSFDVTYTTSSQNRLSLISQITDNTDSGNPRITEFSYGEGDSDFTRNVDWDMPYYLNTNGDPTGYTLGTNSIFIDINNDGLLDFVTTAGTTFESDGGSAYNDKDDTVFLNTGSGFVRDPDWDMPYNGSNGLLLGSNSTFTDINNDGFVDFIYTGSATTFSNDGGSPYNDGYHTVFLNDGYNFVRDPNWDMPYAFDTLKAIPLSANSTFVDINNDGLTDFVSTGSIATTFSNDGGSPYNDYDDTVFINTGTDFVRDPNWVMPYKNYQGVYQAILTTYSTFIDINGDGLSDFVSTANSGSFINDGDSLYNDHDKTVYINNGTNGFYRDPNWDMPYSTQTGSAKGLAIGSSSTFTDVNNDGLPDFIYAVTGTFQPDGGSPYNDYTKTVFINTGTDFVRDVNWDMPYSSSSGAGFGVASYATFTDVNNDGLSDFIYTNTSNNNIFVNDGGSPYNDSDRTVFINTGTDFVNDPDFDMPYYLNNDIPTAFNLNTYSNFTDVNADGFTDFIITCNTPTCSNLVFQSTEGSFYSDPDQTVFLNTGIRDVLLTNVISPYGGELTATYEEKEIDNYYQSKSQLPSSVTVATSISYNDLVNPISTTHYSYDVAKYYFYDENNNYKRFTGFIYSEKIDPNGNMARTYYHQGDGNNTSLGEYDDHVSKIGKPYRIEKFDNNYNLYELVINKWDRSILPDGYDFVKLARVTTITYDGNGTHTDTAYEYVYNSDNGNLEEKIYWGKVSASNLNGDFTDVGTDKLVEHIEYATGEDDLGFFGIPYLKTVKDQGNNKIGETRIYYDNEDLGYFGTLANPTKVEKLVKSGKLGDPDVYVTTQSAYNAVGLPTLTIDANNNTTSYTYDSYNLYPVSVKNALNQFTYYTYDYSSGNVIETIDENGLVYQTVYDALDRVVEEKSPSLIAPYTPITKTTYTYTDTPGATSVKTTNYLDATNSIDTYQYLDGFGRLIQERSEAEGVDNYNVKDTVYDSRGLVAKQSLPYASTGYAKTPKTTDNSLYITNTYDPLGRVKTMTDITGTTTYAYDDWKTTTTDKNSKVKNYYKDAYDNLIKVDEVNGAQTYTTNYTWDLAGNLVKITDALGNIRNFTYDALGRRTGAEDLHASFDTTFGAWMYVYDNNSNLIKAVSPRSNVINYTYNTINQLTSEDATSTSGIDITYNYGGCSFGINKVCSVTTLDAVNTSYAYDSNSNIINELKTISGIPYNTHYTHDYLGNIIDITYPDDALVHYSYNNAGLLDKIESAESGSPLSLIISNYDYNPLGQVSTMTYGNGVTTTNSYNPNSLYRLTRRLTQNPSLSKLQDLNYTYDNAGNIINLTDSSNTATAKSLTYTYDDLYRLTGVSGTYNQSFSYNAIGNILSGPAGSYTYGGNSGNYINPHAATKVGTTSQTYDKEGNVTALSTGSITNTWNYKNQLERNQKGTNYYTRIISNYLYDYTGERAYQNISSYYDGQKVTYYPNDYYNSYTDSLEYLNTKETKQIYGNGELVATIEKTKAYDEDDNIIDVYTTYFNHSDILGSISAVSDISGNLISAQDYYPYGGQRVSSGSYNSQRKYIGEIYDGITELNYLNARYYNSNWGQFISIDPQFWNPEKYLMDPQSLNAYSYARNNPVMNKDGSGMMWTGTQWVHFAGGVVVGAGIALGTAAVIGAIAVASPVVAVVAVGAIAVYGAVEIGTSAYVSYAENNGDISGMLNDVGEYIDDNPFAVGNVVGGVVGCSVACKGASELGGKGASKVAEMVGGMFKKNPVNWARPETLQPHFLKHGADFGAKTPEEYVAKLTDFINKKQYTNSFKEGKDTVYWNKNTNEAVYTNQDGNIKSGYKITNQNKINNYLNRIKNN